jgi:phenylacetate-CoA ligase
MGEQKNTGLDALDALIGEILPGNRFYAEKFKPISGGPKFESWDDYHSRMPFTTKRELVDDQAANPPYGSNLTYDLARYTRFSQTSATSGRPMLWLDSPESWNWMLRNWARVYTAAEVGPGDRILFAFSFGPFLGFWTAFEAAASIGALCIPGGGLSTEGRLRRIVENEVTVVCCTPTYALRLGEVAREEGIDLAGSALRKIIVAGEPGGSIAAIRNRIEDTWPRARMFDHYGMTEIGPVAYEDPEDAGSLRIIEESLHAEIIDPDSGSAVENGEMGELVLTNLGRTACPLLRYRTGDLVCASRDADSGDLILRGGILGRADDMLIIRGVNVYPGAVDEVVRSIPEIDEYQVNVGTTGSLAELAIAIEMSGSDAASKIAERLQSALYVAFSLRINVAVAKPGSLPRFEMKARRWIRNP